MVARNTTFKLTDSDLDLLERLSADMGRSRTDVIRSALAQLDETRKVRRLRGKEFIDRLFETVPDGSTFMIGLDEKHRPYATINGTERRDDVLLEGEPITIGQDEFVRVFIIDPENQIKFKAGVIQSPAGGWLAILAPFSVELA